MAPLGPAQNPVQRERGAVLRDVNVWDHEAYDSSRSGADLKNRWSYTFTPYVLILWCIIKHREKFSYYVCLERLFTVRCR